jgi:hypothetical protein
LVYADGDSLRVFGGSPHALKENVEVLLVSSKEIVLELNADKIKYMLMSRDQTAERIHNIKIHNSYFERIGRVQIFGYNINKLKFNSGRNQEQTEVRECLLSFGAESFIFQFAIRKD